MAELSDIQPAVYTAPGVGEDHRRLGPRRVSVVRAPSLSAINLLASLKKLAQYKDLLWTLSVHRISVRYKQSVLGIFWAILQPLSLMLIFTFVFAFVARMPSDGAPYALFAYTALLPWTFVSSSVSNATNSLVSHAQFVTKVYFPREIVPLSYVIVGLFDFAIASTLLMVLMLYYRVPLTVNAWYAVPLMLLLSCPTIGMGLLFSATQARFRDIGVAVPLLMQLWLFATPVIYPLSAVPPRLRPIYDLNPMVAMIENFRRVLLRGSPPDVASLVVPGALSIVFLVCSYIYFKWVDATMADFI